jgi:hypothetical protein
LLERDEDVEQKGESIGRAVSDFSFQVFEGKLQITSTKFQINFKIQYPITKTLSVPEMES